MFAFNASFSHLIEHSENKIVAYFGNKVGPGVI